MSHGQRPVTYEASQQIYSPSLNAEISEYGNNVQGSKETITQMFTHFTQMIQTTLLGG